MLSPAEAIAKSAAIPCGTDLFRQLKYGNTRSKPAILNRQDIQTYMPQRLAVI